MRKKVWKISITTIGLIIASALLAFCVLNLIKVKNVVETGNVLGVAWYDPDKTEFTISTAEELKEFAKLSDFYNFKDQKVKLDADIVLNQGNAEDWAEQAPAYRWKPISNFAGTFDGQGHTISGVYGKAYEAKMALFINADYACTVQDFKLINSHFETKGYEGTASIVAGGGGKFVGIYSDAIINHKGENAGGIASVITKQSIFEECWFDGRIDITLRSCGGIIDYVNGGRVDVRHCLYSGEIHSPYTFAGTKTGGIVGQVNNAGAAIIQDSLSSGKFNPGRETYSGGIVGVGYAETQTTIYDTYLAADTYHMVTGTINGTLTGNGLLMDNKRLLGTSAYQWTTLDFEKYWSASKDATPILKRFANEELSLEGVEKAFDTSWYSSGSFTFQITNLKQLYGLYYVSASESFLSKTVKLGADIVVNTGNAADWEKEAPVYEWYPIKTFAGIFDGQGHTISGLYSKTGNNYQGFIGNATDKSIIKNLSIKNSFFHNTNETFAGVGSVAGQSYGKLENIYSNAIIISEGPQAGGLLGRSNDSDSDGKEDRVIITNCWFDGLVALKGEKTVNGGGLVGVMVQGDLEISHCLNTGTVSTEATPRGLHIGGFIGRANSGGKLTVTDSLNTGKIDCNYTVCVGSLFGRLFSAFGGIMVADITNTYTTTESYTDAIGNNSTATVTGNLIQMSESWYTGKNAYRYTELDFSNYWALVDNDTPILKTFASRIPSTAGIAKAVDTSWYKQNAKEYVITNREQMLGFAMIATNNSFSGKTVKLGADIKMDSSLPWISIGNGFSGTFDGQGHTISGICQKTDTYRNGLFGMVQYNGVIKNFRLVDSTFEYYSDEANKEQTLVQLGSVCADLRGRMENVYSNATVKSNGCRVGGLVGMPNSVKIKNVRQTVTIQNCWFDGSVTLTGPYARYAGGIVGQAMQGNIEILHCLNTGTVSNEREDVAGFIGGIIGSDQNPGCKITIQDCLNTGKVTAGNMNQVGAIIGGANTKTAVYEIGNTYATEESCVSSSGSAILTNVWKGTVKGVAIAMPKEQMKGTEAYKWTVLDFDNYWATIADDTPQLKSFSTGLSTAGVDKMYDIGWYSESEKNFEIKNAKQLYGFSLLSLSNTFEGQTFKLTDDIGMSAYPNWISVGNTGTPFKGIFDGQGNTIYELNQKTATHYAGLFGYMVDGVVRNIKVEDCSFESTSTGNAFLGGIVGGGSGKLLDSYSNATIKAVGMGVGGLVGRSTGMEIRGCWYEGSINQDFHGSGSLLLGGIVGTGATNATVIDNCLFGGVIHANYTAASEAQAGWRSCVGGIAGADGNVMMTISNTLGAGELYLTWQHNDETGSTSPTSIMSVDDLIGYAQNKDTTYQKNVYSTTSGKWKVVDSGNSGAITGNYSESHLLGVEACRYTELDFTSEAKYWAARKNELPGILKFVATPMDLSNVKLPDITWYDEEDEEFHIMNEEQFYGFAKLVNSGISFSDKIVYLDDNLELNEVKDGTIAAWKSGQKIPDNAWMSIGNESNRFRGTFDGQGHEISGVYQVSATNYMGLFGCVDNGTVKNLLVKNSYIKHTGEGVFAGGIIGYLGGTNGKILNVYCKADIDSNGAEFGGIAGRASGTVQSCWFDGTITATKTSTARISCGGIVGTVLTGDNVTITNCLNTGTISYGVTVTNADANDSEAYPGIGGIFGRERTAATVTIKNCVNAGTITTNHTLGVGAIMGATMKKGSVNVVENCYVTNDSISNKSASELTMIGYYNPVVTDTTLNGNLIVAPSELIGKALYMNTAILLDYTVWTARENDIVVPIYFVGSVVDEKDVMALTDVIDTTWYNETDDKFYLSEEAELIGFAQLVNSGNSFDGKKVYLDADMELNKIENGTVASWKAGTRAENEWSSIGTEANPFKGTFDGQKHTIKGLYQNTSGTCKGLFGVVENGTIQNLNLTDSYILSRSPYTGGIVGWLKGSTGCVQNVYCSADIASSSTDFGGIVGRASGTVSSCWFAGTLSSVKTTSAEIRCGGIAASIKLEDNLTIRNCLNTGSINYTVNSPDNTNTYIGIGGIYGWEEQGGGTLAITNCVHAGLIDTNHTLGIGGIIGVTSRRYKDSNNVITKTTNNVTNCYAIDTGVSSLDKDKVVIIGFANPNNTTTTQTGNAIVSLTDLKGSQIYDNANMKLDYTTWIARNNDVVVPRCFVGNIVADNEAVDISWFDDSATEIHLSKESQLLGFAYLVNAGQVSAGKTVYLDADMELNEITEGTVASWKAGTVPKNVWTPIGTEAKPFQGTFDGQGNTITGLYRKASENYMGMFGYVKNGEIVNLRVENSYFNQTGSNFVYTGGVVGCCIGKISNVYSNATIESSGSEFAGIAGRAQGAVEKCWFAGELSSNKTATAKISCGGIVGTSFTATTLSIINCLNTGKIEYTVTTPDNVNGYVGVGGIYGSARSYTEVSITNCVNTGIITTNHTNAVGCIMGGVWTKDSSTGTWSKITVRNCYGANNSISNKSVDNVSIVGYYNPNVREDLNENAVVAPSTFNGSAIYSNTQIKLDYTAWIARKSDVVIPKCFVGTIVAESEVEEKE